LSEAKLDLGVIQVPTTRRSNDAKGLSCVVSRREPFERLCANPPNLVDRLVDLRSNFEPIRVVQNPPVLQLDEKLSHPVTI